MNSTEASVSSKVEQPQPSAGSYRIQDIAASVENEIRRLKAQVELFWEKELRTLQAFGLQDGMKILECGCGPGHIMEKLMQAFPNSDLTGIDVDPLLVDRCRKQVAAPGGERVRVDGQSISDMRFPDGTFDFVIARLVLEHLPDPFPALREVLRVLKVGGRAVFIDNDFEMHLMTHPDIPELHELYEAYCRCRQAEGGNPRIGRELPGLLQDAGFSNLGLEIVSAHNRLIGDDMFLKSEGSGIPARLVKDGFLPREVMERLARKWHTALQHRHHVLFRQLFVAAGEKPAPGAAQAASAGLERKPSSLPPAQAGILNAACHQDRSGNLILYLQALIAGLLKNGQGLPTDRPMIDLGMDSISSVELANSVAMDLGITISPVDILEAESILEVAARLDIEIELHRQQPGPLSGPTAGGGAGAPIQERAGRSSADGVWEDGYL